MTLAWDFRFLYLLHFFIILLAIAPNVSYFAMPFRISARSSFELIAEEAETTVSITFHSTSASLKQRKQYSCIVYTAPIILSLSLSHQLLTIALLHVQIALMALLIIQSS